MTTLEELNSGTAEAFATGLAGIFEHSPWIAEAAAANRPFATVQSLRDALLDVLSKSTRESRLALIRAHPELAACPQRSEALTYESTTEQNGAGLDSLSHEEMQAFETGNEAYKAKFGFPFVLCVRRHTKDSILSELDRRLRSSAELEEEQALIEICRIASLRLVQSVQGPGAPVVNGRLSTHVLDTHGGIPAANVALELRELSRHGNDRLIVVTSTNVDGRTDGPLIGGRPLPIGNYELRFAVGDYFAGRRGLAAPRPFLDIVPVRFGISEPEGHLHVPLVVSPWSYATYRGS